MTLTISPNSVDELRDRLTAWFSQSPKSVNSSFRFQRISPEEGQVVIRSVPLRGIRFRWNPDNLVFEERHRKVNLRLEGFEVNTEIQPTKILITFKRGYA